MSVTANAIETYDSTMIREDLRQAYTMISPVTFPYQQMAGSENVSNVKYEWPIVELAAVSTTNRVIEGEAAPGNDAPTLGIRLSNYSQISDKVVEVSHTAEAVDAAAGNIQRIAEQIVLKMKELKRDTEAMLLQNIVAAPGASGTARSTAGLPAFLRSNSVSALASGTATAPTLSGTTDGYPDAAWTFATPVAGAFLEADLNEVIQKCWDEGAEPSVIMCRSGDKRTMSATFTGNSTRYKDAVDKKLVATIDFYSSDFGELTVIPNRFQQPLATDVNAVYVLDPEYICIAYLETVSQKPLAETGHAKRRLVWHEYGNQIKNQKAHGIIVGTTNTLPV